MKRVIFCGGRDFDRWTLVVRAIDALVSKHGQIIVVHGDARGADSMVDERARMLGLEVEPHPADWAKHGKSAGPIRNRAMLKAGADAVVAFPGGRGTADMVRAAKKAGVPVWDLRCG